MVPHAGHHFFCVVVSILSTPLVCYGERDPERDCIGSTSTKIVDCDCDFVIFPMSITKSQ